MTDTYADDERVERKGPNDYYPGKYGGYGMPRGPIADHKGPFKAAIGFCPFCGANARGTCRNRGTFDCPRCTYFWYDERVGTQPKSFEDFFSET